MTSPASESASSSSTGPSTGAGDIPPFRYERTLANKIEIKWQNTWEDKKTFEQPNPGQAGFDPSKPKFYCLDMFPYPSGAGLHVGHPEGYTATDILSRYKRMMGFNVLHPMGWDAFGLPAEQYAIQTGIHPAITTRTAIDNFRRQLKRFGFSYDWSREFGTIDPAYYKWTQWIFLQIYDAWFDEGEGIEAARDRGIEGKARPISELVAMLERGDIAPNVNPRAGEVKPITPASASWQAATPAQKRTIIDSYRLAYLGEQTVNWCPKLGTVLANDEVIDGKSERGGYPVLRKPLKQWTFRITTYAERLLEGLKHLQWPESTKTMQSEWIGKSEGAEIDFEVVLGTPSLGEGRLDTQSTLPVFTTRPDTLFGATYMVVAPEHPLVSQVLANASAETNVAAVRAYVEHTKSMSDVDRMENKEKTGVFLGVYAINPATGEKVPVWVADYVLMGYGHGAIMAVPAHDERDFEFATRFGLPIRKVVSRLPFAGINDVSSDFWRLDSEWTSTTTGYCTVYLCEYDRGFSLAEVVEKFPDLAEGCVQISDREVAVRLTVEDGVQRLHELEKALPVRFATNGEKCFSGDGACVNSSSSAITLNTLPTPQAKAAIIAWIESKHIGRHTTNYRLRDWTFSRQRYWGEPFPIVFDEAGNHYPVGDAALPVVLPELADYAPIESDDPMPLLAKATDWFHTTAGAACVSSVLLPSDTPVRREANTMPGSAGSSWYAIRYCDPRNDNRIVGEEAERYWMGGAYAGVDQYMGGSEHAVGHLLYSRFWHMILHDLGHVSTMEPFQRLFHQGLITSFAYQRKDKTLVAVDLVEEVADGKFMETATGQPVAQITAKMSKSLKNVVNPDEIIAEFGADTFRLYEMYMGPLEATKPWNTRDIVGLFRFLQRQWRVMVNEQTGELKVAATRSDAIERQLHKTIAKVGPDIERMAFNTAIASLIEFVNLATKEAGEGVASASLTKDQIDRFVRVIAPFTPHVAEELWAKLGHSRTISHEPFPKADPAMIAADTIEIPVQILGKVRSKVTLPAGSDEKAMEAAALADEKIKALLEGKTIKKMIVVKGKLVNIVV